jgi:hypothetical protein
MKAKLCPLPDLDENAKRWIVDTLRLLSATHTLSRKLLERFEHATGAISAIIPDICNVDDFDAYEFAIIPPGVTQCFEPGCLPVDKLTEFVWKFLNAVEQSLFVCENSGLVARTNDYWAWANSLPPRNYLGNDELYHIFDQHKSGCRAIEEALSGCVAHRSVSMCSVGMPPINETYFDERYLDSITVDTRHIIVTAFDDEGYLVWTLNHA